MAEERSQPALPPAMKSPTIPVGLQEAAVDSPTFRATVIQFSAQVEIVERWLESYLRATQKLAHEVTALEEVVNSYLNRLNPPPLIAGAVLDHDNTLPAVKRYGEGTREFWTVTIAAMRRTESTVIEPIRQFLGGELKSFKVTDAYVSTVGQTSDQGAEQDNKRTLDHSQRCFDALLSRFAAQPRSKEPSALREDAFQLYETRKKYIKSSMDFCEMVPQFRFTLDVLLVKVCTEQWQHLKKSQEGSIAGLDKANDEITRVRNWSDKLEGGEKVMRRELSNTRRMLEEQTANATRPSRELDDYSASTVPFLGSRGVSNPALPSPNPTGLVGAEKQGWLYQRTITVKPTRTMWLRRWFFLKNGIFGCSVQGARGGGGGVEESERIGVLLCSAKPAFQEERRFCFEVKTKDNTVLLQAENQAELLDWLDSFENAKRKAVEDTSDPSSPATNIHNKGAAFALSPNQTQDSPEGHTAPDETPASARFGGLSVSEREGGIPLANWSSFEIAHARIVVEREFEAAKDGDGGREPTSLKLPAHPVVYEPEGYGPSAADREFEISPKALFHVMFGDKSAVFQLLYQQRRAQRIRQGPWTQVEDGRLCRAFEYQIDYVGLLGRTRQANVADNQTIDVLDDHLRYVITDRKTPWHLPHHEDFILVTCIVITHVAKSRCRLAIYTKVEWTRPPTFSKGLVETQALSDLSLDAGNLADVLTDQVRRLGPSSGTKKAISIFGQVGQQTSASLVAVDGNPAFPSTGRLPIRQRSLGWMIGEMCVSIAGSGVSSLMIWGFAGVREAWKIAKAERILLLVLVASLVMNGLTASGGVQGWWAERGARGYMRGLGVGSPTMSMRREIGMRDLHELTSWPNDSDSTSGPLGVQRAVPRGQCRQMFTHLNRSAGGLDAYRHNLLVALRVVNDIEREMVEAAWERFQRAEVARCAKYSQRARKSWESTSTERAILKQRLIGRPPEELMQYCDSCVREGIGS